MRDEDLPCIILSMISFAGGGACSIGLLNSCRGFLDAKTERKFIQLSFHIIYHSKIPSIKLTN